MSRYNSRGGGLFVADSDDFLQAMLIGILPMFHLQRTYPKIYGDMLSDTKMDARVTQLMTTVIELEHKKMMAVLLDGSTPRAPIDLIKRVSSAALAIMDPKLVGTIDGLGRVLKEASALMSDYLVDHYARVENFPALFPCYFDFLRDNGDKELSDHTKQLTLIKGAFRSVNCSFAYQLIAYVAHAYGEQYIKPTAFGPRPTCTS